MTVIKVPKTPKSAFNKDRPASSLLQAQIEHLEAAAGIYATPTPARRRRKPRTEGQAAAYIHALTGQIQRRGGKPYATAEGDAMPATEPPGARKRPRPKPQGSRKPKTKQRKAR